MSAKRLAMGLLMASIGGVGCSSAQKAGCASCRSAEKPTASLVQESKPVAPKAQAAAKPEMPAVAEVKPATATAPTEVTTASKPAPEMPIAPVAESQSAMRSHAEDYSELVGELHYNARTSEWRLRYAAHDAEDRYGGSVTLKDPRHLMTEFASGQTVRVHGELADRDARRPSPDYVLRSVAPLQSR